jgi:hypothetical protein
MGFLNVHNICFASFENQKIYQSVREKNKEEKINSMQIF